MFEFELCSLETAGHPDEPGDLRYRPLLGCGDVEVLVLARRVDHGGDDAVCDVIDVGQGAGLLAGSEDLQRPLSRKHLSYEVGNGVRDPRLEIGHLAGTVRVEGPADREWQAVLVV